MKYFPLIWAALWRKPVRLVLTLLSVTVAFTLLGITTGISASYAHLVELSHMNRIYVSPRFGGTFLPLAMQEQLAHGDGVTVVGGFSVLIGYYQDKKNSSNIIMMNQGMRTIFTELPLTPQQWDQLFASRTGVFVSRSRAERFGLKAGDTFPFIAQFPPRDDKSTTWIFKVLAVVDDTPQSSNGFMVGDYEYLDQAVLASQRSKVFGYQLLIRDPDRASATAKEIDNIYASSGTPTRSIPEKTLQEGASQAGLNIPFITEAVAGAGLFMILFLTGNGIAQSVRERIPEFAVLKTLGFSDLDVMMLVFTEAAVPCLLGAAIGLMLALMLASETPRLMPNAVLPVPYLSLSVLGQALLFAALVAFASAVIPALRIKRLDVATALSGR